LVSLVAGVVVGLFTYRADLGIAVTSGVGTVLGCLEAVMIKQFK